MASRSFGGAVLSALLVFVLSAPAVAAAPAATVIRPTAEHLAARLPAGAIAMDGQGLVGRTSVTDSVTRVKDHRDHRARLRAVAEFLQERAGASVATGGVASSSSSTPEEVVAEPGYSAWAEGVPAGDLDGDGLADIVTYAFDPGDNSLMLAARRGTDGGVLWQHNAVGEGDGGLSWPLQRDIDGDGATELLTYDLIVESAEETHNCGDDGEGPCDEYRYVETFRWVVGLRSGRTGEQLWSRGFDGSLEESYKETSSRTLVVRGYDGSYEFSGTNVDVYPVLADLAGDGGTDVLLQAFDVRYAANYDDTYVATPISYTGVFSGASTLLAETRVHVVDGRDGSETAALRESGQGLVASVSAVDAPGGSDLVWERALYPDSDFQCVYVWSFEGIDHCTGDQGDETLGIELIDGATFDSLWTTSVDSWGFVWPLDGDLDADGTEDLAILTDDGGYDLTTDFVAGASGKTLWGVDSGIPAAVQSLDEAAGDDVLLVVFEANEDDPLGGDYVEQLTIERRSGSDGTLLASSTRSTATDSDAEFSGGMLYVSTTGDLDADGVGDLTHGVVTYTGECIEDEEEGEHYCEITSVSSDAVAESGRSGTQLRHEGRPDGVLILTGLADVDGDGRDELARETEAWSADGPTSATFSAVTVEGATLWTDDLGSDWVYYEPAGNLDGGAGQDLLRTALSGFGDFVDGEPAEEGGAGEGETAAEGESVEGGSSESFGGYSMSVAAVDGGTGVHTWALPAR